MKNNHMMLKEQNDHWNWNIICVNLYWMLVASIACYLVMIGHVAASTIFDVGTDLSNDFYDEVLLISTPLMGAVVAATQLVYMWSGNAKIAEPAKEWRNRALFGWVTINGLAFFVNYAQKFFTGGTLS